MLLLQCSAMCPGGVLLGCQQRAPPGGTTDIQESARWPNRCRDLFTRCAQHTGWRTSWQSLAAVHCSSSSPAPANCLCDKHGRTWRKTSHTYPSRRPHSLSV